MKPYDRAAKALSSAVEALQDLDGRTLSALARERVGMVLADISRSVVSLGIAKEADVQLADAWRRDKKAGVAK